MFHLFDYRLFIPIRLSLRAINRGMAWLNDGLSGLRSVAKRAVSHEPCVFLNNCRTDETG